MSGLQTTHWQQWDRQEILRVLTEKRIRQDMAYIQLNNLFLQVQRGQVALSITVSNQLRVLVGQAYDQNDGTMNSYWERELQTLPGWENF